MRGFGGDADAINAQREVVEVRACLRDLRAVTARQLRQTDAGRCFSQAGRGGRLADLRRAPQPFDLVVGLDGADVAQQVAAIQQLRSGQADAQGPQVAGRQLLQLDAEASVLQAAPAQQQ